MGSVAGETKIRAWDDASLKVLESAIGSGTYLLDNLNRERKKQGLKECTGVSSSSSSSSARPTDETSTDSQEWKIGAGILGVY